MREEVLAGADERGKSQEVPAIKRKAPNAVPSSGPNRESKKARKPDVGIHADWESRGSVAQDNISWETERALTQARSQSAASMQSSDAGKNEANGLDEFGGGDDKRTSSGMVADNEGLGEEAAARELEGVDTAVNWVYFRGTSKQHKTNVPSLASVNPTTSVATFIPPTQSIQVAEAHMKNKDKIRYHHLPTHLQATFDKKFYSRLYILLGTFEPWERLADATIAQLFHEVYPAEEELTDFEARPASVIQRLMHNLISNWRHKFSEVALRFLEKKLFPKKFGVANNTDNRSAWAVQALSGDEYTHPFYYLKWEPSSNDMEKPKQSGLFQHPLIIVVFASHIARLRSADLLSGVLPFPTAALIHSIQAAEYTIEKYLTGDPNKAPEQLGRWAGSYSKSSRGLRVKVDEKKQEAIVNYTRILDVAIGRLSQTQKKKILEAAIEATTTAGRRALTENTAPIAAPEPDVPEFADDDSNLTSDEREGDNSKNADKYSTDFDDIDYASEPPTTHAGTSEGWSSDAYGWEGEDETADYYVDDAEMGYEQEAADPPCSQEI
ncbi:hypothetical protein NP233_g13046 [Leucocoprinus birnbaumii]|uniref:DUF6532 domain-containing protein n=1 Tax=Leucocoprinus birnbaumii TaxID=56174 RepID=A0AAD5YJV3_9AGAR|nr:hypothetical protein NP233_g13046 [Leucocoprinus birnbaumii]